MSHQSQNTFPVDNAKEAAEWLESATDGIKDGESLATVDTFSTVAIAHSLLALREELNMIRLEIRDHAAMLSQEVNA